MCTGSCAFFSYQSTYQFDIRTEKDEKISFSGQKKNLIDGIPFQNMRNDKVNS